MLLNRPLCGLEMLPPPGQDGWRVAADVEKPVGETVEIEAAHAAAVRQCLQDFGDVDDQQRGDGRVEGHVCLGLISPLKSRSSSVASFGTCAHCRK